MREKLILKRLELEREKEGKWIDARVNSQVERQLKSQNPVSKSRKRNDEIMNKITDLIESRQPQSNQEFSVIPKIKGMNINVLLKGFKDALVERSEEEGKFDPLIYKRYDINADFDYDIMGSDDLESRMNETLNLNKDQLESESAWLLRWIIRVEHLSQKLNDTNVELILEDLEKILERR